MTPKTITGIAGTTLTAILIIAMVFPMQLLAADFGTGSEHIYDSDAQGSMTYTTALGEDHFLGCLVVGGSTDDYDCDILNVSGLTVTSGSQFEVDAAVTTNFWAEVCAVGTNRWVAVYADSTGDGFLRVGTSTGSAFGSQKDEFEFSTTDAESPVCREIRDNTFVVVYNDEGDSDTGKGKVCELDASNDVSCGSDYDFHTTDYYPDAIACDSVVDDEFVCVFLGDDLDDLFVVGATVSGTTITWGTVDTIRAGSFGSFQGIVDIAMNDDGTSWAAVHNDGTTIDAYEGTFSAGETTVGDSVTVYSGNNVNARVNIVGQFNDNEYIVSWQGNSTENYLRASVCTDNGATITCNANEAIRSESVQNKHDLARNPGTNEVMFVYSDTAGDDGNAIFATTSITIGGAGNTTPTITSVSDTPDPQTVGSDITFSVDWNDADGEGVSTYVCDTSATSTSGCASTTYCSHTATSTASDPQTCLYTTQEADVAASPVTYWTFVCDDEGDDSACSTATSSTFSVEAAATTTSPIIELQNGVSVGGSIIIK